MRFDRFTVPMLCAAFTLLTMAPMSRTINAQDAASRLHRIASANSLDLPGKTPFHLKMSFQLYDLVGKPSDTGIIEEWWASPGQSRTTIIAASLKQSEPALFDGSLAIDPRERYLLQELLQAQTQPLPVALSSNLAKLDETRRKFDKTFVRCFDRLTVDHSSDEERPGPSLPRIFCVDPGTDTLLLEFTEGSGHTIMRKDIGVFHETSIPLEPEVLYAGRPAIIGKIVKIKAFDPVTSEPVLASQTHREAGENDQHRLTWAKDDKCAYAKFPEAAWFAHENGIVVLSGLVTKSGTVTNVVVIASSNPVFTVPMIEAFSRCTFKPYLLDGEPTEDRITYERDFTEVNHSGMEFVSGAASSAFSPH